MADVPMSAVTHKPKCYVSVCAGCGRLDQSERSDTLTCSPACRVRAHRNGSLKALRAIALSLDIRPATILQCKAVIWLRPDLAEQLSNGKLTINAAQSQMRAAFLELLKEAMT